MLQDCKVLRVHRIKNKFFDKDYPPNIQTNALINVMLLYVLSCFSHVVFSPVFHTHPPTHVIFFRVFSHTHPPPTPTPTHTHTYRYPNTRAEFKFYNRIMKERADGWSPLGDTFRPSRAGQPLTSCEVQLTLQDFLKIKHLMHAYYNIERSTDDAFVLRKPIFMEDSCVEKTPNIVLEMRNHEEYVKSVASKFLRKVSTQIVDRKKSLPRSPSDTNTSRNSLTSFSSGIQSLWHKKSSTSSSDLSTTKQEEMIKCHNCSECLGSRGRKCVKCNAPFCKSCKKLKMQKFAVKSWQCIKCPSEMIDLESSESLKFTPRGFGSPHNFVRVSQTQLKGHVSGRLIVSQGYLLKRSSGILFMNPSWKPYFFCIVGTELKYWENFDAYKAKSKCRHLDLKDASLQETEGDKYCNKDWFCFSVTSPGGDNNTKKKKRKTIHLCAYTDDERQNWMCVINEVSSGISGMS